MAKDINKLDQLFKEKLASHEEKPSALAWERLEARLPQKSKSYKGVWWAAAAAVLVLFTTSYFFIKESKTIEQATLTATTTPSEIEEEPKQTSELITLDQSSEELPAIQPKRQAPSLKPKPTPTNAPQKQVTQLNSSNAAEKLIAQKEENAKLVEINRAEIALPKLNEIEIQTPEIRAMDLSKTIAAAANTTSAEEPAYKVTIYSNGSIEDDSDKGLIAGIGKKVEKAGGLAGIVDQGFADLQDAKNNLYISLVSKKPKDSE